MATDIKVADGIGFCFGVKRAIRMAQDALKNNKGKGVYSLGHIIHNSQVVEELSKEGLRAIRGLDGIKEGTVVISSHGASPKVIGQIKKKGLDLVDATCPYVKSSQKIVKSLSEEDYTVLILGDSQHPEVKSLVGFANDKAMVIKDEEEMDKINISSKKIGLVSQTTQSEENYFRVISKILKREFSELRIFNTICNDTKKRQDSAARLAKDVDVMIIVGGRMSANTKRLFEICSRVCGAAYHIETVKELKKEWLEARRCVGIASGASTPDWVIEDVKNEILSIRGIYVQ